MFRILFFVIIRIWKLNLKIEIKFTFKILRYIIIIIIIIQIYDDEMYAIQMCAIMKSYNNNNNNNICIYGKKNSLPLKKNWCNSSFGTKKKIEWNQIFQFRFIFEWNSCQQQQQRRRQHRIWESRKFNWIKRKKTRNHYDVYSNISEYRFWNIKNKKIRMDYGDEIHMVHLVVYWVFFCFLFRFENLNFKSIDWFNID